LRKRTSKATIGGGSEKVRTQKTAARGERGKGNHECDHRRGKGGFITFNKTSVKSKTKVDNKIAWVRHKWGRKRAKRKIGTEPHLARGNDSNLGDEVATKVTG